MKTRLSPLQLLAVGLMLLAMFLGAGNTIFAPMVGQQAGEDVWTPMVGFLLTGVGLVLLAIIALALAGGRVELLAARVHPTFSVFFCVLLFLTLGPVYVIPRTTSVVHEISVRPILEVPESSASLLLLAFSAVFIALTVLLSLNPSKLVDRLGKVITPIFSVLLLAIIVRAVVAPMGAPQEAIEPYTDGAFLAGFTEGYFTMDALAALVFGGIFIQSIKALGVTSREEKAGAFIKAGLITVLGLCLLHVSLAWIGASSVEAVGRLDNGGAVLAASAGELLGYAGVLMIGLVILLTGLTTNIACLSAVAEYFSRIVPRVSYPTWVVLLALVSLVITNFGLAAILDMAIPVLFLLYPMAIMLIVLVLTNTVFGGHRAVYLGAMIGASVVACVDAVKQAGVLAEEIDAALGFLPLFAGGGGWILPAILGGLIALVVARMRKDARRRYDHAGLLVPPAGAATGPGILTRPADPPPSSGAP